MPLIFNVMLRKGPTVLHPNQFQINEAWILFKLNDAPLVTESDGDFNLFALMDAASCFILSSGAVPLAQAEPSKMEAMRLLKQAHAHKQKLPITLFVPTEQPATLFVTEAERLGISVVLLPSSELQLFVGEAKEGFKEQFGGGDE